MKKINGRFKVDSNLFFLNQIELYDKLRRTKRGHF